MMPQSARRWPWAVRFGSARRSFGGDGGICDVRAAVAVFVASMVAFPSPLLRAGPRLYVCGGGGGGGGGDGDWGKRDSGEAAKRRTAAATVAAEAGSWGRWRWRRVAEGPRKSSSACGGKDVIAAGRGRPIMRRTHGTSIVQGEGLSFGGLGRGELDVCAVGGQTCTHRLCCRERAGGRRE